MNLKPGTVVLTGTPSGVGFTRTPPVFLKPGDLLETRIQGLGTLTNPILQGFTLELIPEPELRRAVTEIIGAANGTSRRRPR